MNCLKKLNSDVLITIALIIYLLLMMAYAAFSLSLSIQAYVETLKFSLDFAGIQNNWSSDVINFLKIVQYPNECPSSTNVLFTYTWPGTFEGCDCTNSNSAQKLIYNEPCTKSQNNSNCLPISPLNQQPFQFWKDQYKICIARITDYNFASNHLKSSINCPAGQIPCGQSIDNIFCVQNSTSCPITSMVVSDVNPDPVLYLESEKFFGRYQLWYSRLADKTPIVQGKISENNPCFDYSLTNIDPNESDYILLSNPRTYCQEDMRWVGLDSITEWDFYDANVNITNLTSLLPNFTISEYVNQQLWTQYYRNIIPMKFNFICRSAIEKLVVSDQVYSTEIDTQLINLCISAFVFFIYIFVFPYFQIALLFKRGCKLRKLKDEVILTIRNEQKNSLARSIKLLQFPFVLVAMIISFSDLQIFDEIYNNKCSDDITNLQFKQAADNIRDKTYGFNLSTLIFLVVLIGLDGIIMLVGAIMGLLKPKEKLLADNEEYLQLQLSPKKSGEYPNEKNEKPNIIEMENMEKETKNLKEKFTQEEVKKDEINPETLSLNIPKTENFEEMDIDEK